MGGKTHPIDIANEGRNWDKFQIAKSLLDGGIGLGHLGHSKHLGDMFGTYQMRPDGGGYGNRLAVEQVLRSIMPFLEEEARKINAKKQADADAAKAQFETTYAIPSVRSPDSKLNMLKNLLQSERSRVSGLQNQTYSGPTSVDISPLTRRMQELQDRNSPEYMNEIQSLQDRSGKYQGLTGANQDLIKQFLSQRDRHFRQSMERNFEENFRNKPGREEKSRLNALSSEQVDERAPVFDEDLSNMAEDIALGNEMEDQQKSSLLYRLQNMNQGDKNNLLNLLDKGGKTDNSITKMGIEAGKRNFYNQQAVSAKALQNLEQELSPHLNYEEAANQDSKNAREHAIRRRSIIEQGGSDIGGYQSNLSNHIAPHTNVDQIKSVYDTQKYSAPNMKVAPKNANLINAERDLLNADLRHSDYHDNQLQNLMQDEESKGNRMAEGAINSLRNRMAYDDKRFEKELNAEVSALGNKFTNNYNSPEHIRQVQNLIAARTAQRDAERQKHIMSGMDRQKLLGKLRGDISSMGMQLSALGDNALNKNYLEQLATSHKRGVDEFDRDQDEEDTRLENQVMNNNYAWPGLRAAFAASQYNVSPLTRYR